MSSQYYYQAGNHLSKTMKDDAHRVRMNKPDRFVTVVDGKTKEVVEEADATAMSPRERHNFCTKVVKAR